MTDVASNAYAAGLFDGEGCVLIAYPKSSGSNGRSYHRLDVSIGNTDLRPLVWLRETYGGRIQDHIQKKKQHHLRAWQWRIGGKDQHAFLLAIRPYSRIKPEQIDTALAFIATVTHEPGAHRAKGGGWTKKNLITPEVEANREGMRGKLQVLKRQEMTA